MPGTAADRCRGSSDIAGCRFLTGYGGRVRARYTTVDFLEGQGVLEQALDFAL